LALTINLDGFLNPLCREYLKSLYTQIPKICEDKENYIWTNKNFHIWNDMNEPACFNIHAKSMIKGYSLIRRKYIIGRA
jgi:alpha-glucosidase (family GH31 glycosyl hydrolase)